MAITAHWTKRTPPKTPASRSDLGQWDKEASDHLFDFRRRCLAAVEVQCRRAKALLGSSPFCRLARPNHPCHFVQCIQGDISDAEFLSHFHYLYKILYEILYTFRCIWFRMPISFKIFYKICKNIFKGINKKYYEINLF